MKGRAFTLVELLAVIAVLALVAAILLPSMTSAYALGRSQVCKGNLYRIGQAFTASSNARSGDMADAGGTVAAKTLVNAYPKAMSWPTIPADAVPDRSLYLCPEGPVVEGPQEDMFKLLEYVCPYGSFPMNVLNGKSTFYISRTGEDEKGTYTDYMLQDDYGNGQFELMNFNGWFDTDGFCRVYHSGYIHVFDRVPNTPEFAGATGPGYPDRVNTCGDLNAIRFRGKPAFGTDGMLRNYRGQTFKLEGWQTGCTNYGINSWAHKYPFGASCLVLVDYNDLIVELDTPLEAEKILVQSARHLKKVNYLLADGAVKSAAPLGISPRLRTELWKPPRP